MPMIRFMYSELHRMEQVVEYTSVSTEQSLEHHGQQLICLMLQILTLQHLAGNIYFPRRTGFV